MIRRALLSTLLALSLVLTGLTAVVAETRMAAAGGYCGTGAPQLLLDGSGLPILDADGAALAAPDCPACTLAWAQDLARPPLPALPTTLLGAAAPQPEASLSLPAQLRAAQPRGPPSVV